MEEGERSVMKVTAHAAVCTRSRDILKGIIAFCASLQTEESIRAHAWRWQCGD